MIDKSPHHLTTLVALLVLTGATTATVSSGNSAWLAMVVLIFALVKMQLVAFRFMDLRHAHLFWKGSFVFLTIAFLSTLTLLSLN